MRASSSTTIRVQAACVSSPVSASALGSTLVGVTAAVLRPATRIPVPAGYGEDPMGAVRTAPSASRQAA